MCTSFRSFTPTRPLQWTDRCRTAQPQGNVTISNDGATIMKTLDIVHPAAKTLVDISLSQDAEVGDGTTTVVLLAAEFLRECKTFVEEGVHPQAIIRAFRQAAQLAVARVKELAIDIAEGKGEEERKELLRRCAATSLSSKLVSGEREFFADMVVDAVTRLDPRTLDLRMLVRKACQSETHVLVNLGLQGSVFDCGCVCWSLCRV